MWGKKKLRKPTLVELQEIRISELSSELDKLRATIEVLDRISDGRVSTLELMRMM